MSHTVVVYRISNGDELIAKQEDGVPEQITIKLEKVRHIMVSRTSDGIGISLMPWSFCNVDGDVILNKSAVMAQLAPSADMVSSYLQQITGIQLTP